MSSIILIRDNFKNFILDEYKNILNKELITNFLKEYEVIQKQDFIKPIFTLTKKYSNYSNKNESEWKKYEAKNDIDKIKEIIKSNLNKISKDNFNIISKKLILDIKKFEKKFILDIIVDEIYAKTVFDIKFQHIYLETIKNIWSDKSFYKNLVNIKKQGNQFYWSIKEDNNSNGQVITYGPFISLKFVENDIYKNLSLKKNFINKLQREFKMRDEYMKLLDDETIIDNERFKVQRNIFGLYEIIINLFYSNNLPIFFINYILHTLFKNKELKYYLESINSVLNLFVNNKLFNSLTHKQKGIRKHNIDNYLLSIKSLDKNNYNTRIKFIILDIEEYLNKFSSIFHYKNNSSKVNNNFNNNNKNNNIDFEKEIKDNLLKNNYKKITYLLKNNMYKIEDNLLTLFDFLFEYQDKLNTVVNIVSFLLGRNIITMSILNKIYGEINDNLDDLELDISNIRIFFTDMKKEILSSTNH